EDLDKNRDLLIDSKYLAPLRADAEKQILGVSYVSEKFVREANSTNRQLDDAAEMIGLAVAEIDAPPPLQAEIKKDVQTLFDGFKSLIPEPGAAASYSYFSERGIEGISHNWSENKTLDASQELSLLNHVGGSPIFFAVGRSKPVDGWYDALVHAGKRGLYYFEQFAESELSNDERQILALAKEKATPLLKRLDAANREQWGPGLSDEGGLVFDATQLDGPIHPAVPPVDAPLLLPELAIIHGVADKEKIKTGINEYWAVLKAAWNEVKAVAEGEVPPIEVPDLQVTKANGGELFQIPLGQLGVGEAIGPNAAVSDDVLVLSLSPLTGQRLLKPGAARTGGPLLRESRALGAASHFNWAKFVDTLVSWTEYGLAVGAEVDPDGEEVFEQYKVFRPQIEPVVNVLKCFRSATAVTYTSDGATVTHYELHFRDLE
ncbi:MAG: hypothetical protein QGG36_04115, partial [Pirellulaceae bacterium]|nr:hypothetical protein [Pirellulaceae bacterium]